jgi:hypothetical protein
MTKKELAVIREFVTEREAAFMPLEWGADNTIRDAVGHIRALLVEAERLRENIERQHRTRDCECGHLSMKHDSVVRCVTCDAEVGVH